MGKARKVSLALVAGAAALSAGLATSASASGTNLLNNGGFESTAVTGDYTTYGASYGTGADLGGWTVDSGSVDVIGTYWVPAEGSQSLDLSGNEPGSISQTITTIPGVTYHISFALSANPDASPSRSAAAAVTWNGAAVTGSPFSFDSTNATRGAMNWAYQSADVVAGGNSATLAFTSNTGDPYGPALDDISVTQSNTGSSVTNTKPSQGSFTNNKTTAVFHALVTSSDPTCAIGRPVTFHVVLFGTSTPAGPDQTVPTDGSGLASAKYTVSAAKYTVTASVATTPSCGTSTATDSYSFVAPKK